MRPWGPTDPPDPAGGFARWRRAAKLFKIDGMNSTTITPSAFPPPTPGSFPPPRLRSEEPADGPDTPSGRQLPRLSAAGWLAATGASLLLVASIIVVAGNWQSIDPIVRFSGLVASLLAVYFAAEAGRRRFPTTSTSLATLAACLTAPVGIAAAATLSQPWTVCTLVGGLAALVATEVQSRRWDVAPLKAATVVAFGLAAVGAAALTSIPAPLIGAVGAAVSLLLGSTRRTLALAVTVGASPLLVALADAGIGTGTLARIFATGDVLVWSAPLSCAIAALVIGAIAHRSQNAPLAVTSLAVLGSGVVTSLVSGEFGAVVWFCVPAIVVLAAESVAATRTESIWRHLARIAAEPVGGILGAAALASPFVALAARWDTSASDVASSRWYVPLGLWAVALIATSAGSARRSGGSWGSVAPLAASAAALAALAMSGAPTWTLAIAALVGWIAISVVTPWSSWDATTAGLATWVVLAAFVDEGLDAFWLVTVIVAGIATVVSCSVVGRNDAGFRTIVAAGIAALCATAIADGTADVLADRVTWSPDQLGTLLFIALIAIGVGIRPERSLWPLGIAGYVAVVAATATDNLAHDIDWFQVTVVAFVGGAVAGTSRSLTGARSHIAAAIATVAGGLALMAAGVDAGTSTVAVSLVGIGLSGLAALDRRLVTGQTAGLVASIVAVVMSDSASPIFVSIAYAVLGAQIVAIGIATNRRWAVPIGAVLTGSATISLWWTTGTNQWVIDAIAPYGADGGDVALAAVTAALLVGGWLLRRMVSVTSWLAYSPGLGMAGTWLIATQLEAGTDWATFGALIVGTVALAIGGVRRLGAPLVLGTVMVVATMLVSAGERLAATPTWAWIAVGGVGLLVIAALIERSERPLLPMGRRSNEQQSVLEQFCDEFQ